MTRVAVLTPTGTGAIATLAVAGPAAWQVVRSLFRPASGKPLPEKPEESRFWFGTLGNGPGDEVVVAVTSLDPQPWVEVHCHGGRRVVNWVVEQFTKLGCAEANGIDLCEPRHCIGGAYDPRALEPLTRAVTTHTASILLDQYHGAFVTAVGEILAGIDRGDTGEAAARLNELANLAAVGRHLVTPWRVTIAGAPNVGKSSLVNALAGYQRAIVAPVAGTTRDVVTTTVAFDGWPVELADTAGLRVVTETLETAGIELARQHLTRADLVVWVVDASDPNPTWPADADLPGGVSIVVANKTDLSPAWELEAAPVTARLSATTGAGLEELVSQIACRLVPHPVPPGAAVPFTAELADAVETARELLTAGEVVIARETLATCLPEG